MTSITFTATKDAGLGWLLWWSLPKSFSEDPADARRTAAAHGVPTEFVSSLLGRDSLSAWRRVISAFRAIPSISLDSDGEGTIATYGSRSMPGAPEARVIVREVRDAANVRVTVDQVASLLMVDDLGAVDVQLQLTDRTAPLEGSLQSLLDTLVVQYQGAINKVDGNRVRSSLLWWLSRNNRVSLRQAGGVYFLPLPEDKVSADALLNEVSSISGWINADVPQGSMSVIYASRTGGTTVDTIISSAMEEIVSEAEEIEGRLRSYRRNQNMNAGSLRFSTSEMVARISRLHDRMKALLYLGEEIAVTEAQILLVQKEAERMEADAAARIGAQRQEKNALAQDAPSKGAKVGTARQRRRKKSFN